MKLKKIFLFSVFLSLASIDSNAQCAMCRRVAESSTEAQDNKVGRGLNTGILYLLAIPYVLGGIGFYMWNKNKKS
jgi:hypothetical protein